MGMFTHARTVGAELSLGTLHAKEVVDATRERNTERPFSTPLPCCDEGLDGEARHADVWHVCIGDAPAPVELVADIAAPRAYLSAGVLF